MSARPGHPRDEDLEELSDDVILAQETAVHAPAERTKVATDHPSVVIADAGATRGRMTVRRRRESTEQTVVIRDRRKLEKMRKEIAERRPRSRPAPKPRLVEPRTLYLLAAAAVGSLLVGTLIAALFDAHRQNRLVTGPIISSVPAPAAAPSAAKPAIDTIDLDALPVDRSRRHKH